MKKFVVIYHGPESPMDQMANASAEDIQKAMELWAAWAASCGSSLVDMGSPFAGGKKISKSGSSPSDKQVVGYSILQAEDMESAKALLEGHPHLEWAGGGEIEVHESAPQPM